MTREYSLALVIRGLRTYFFWRNQLHRYVIVVDFGRGRNLYQKFEAARTKYESDPTNLNAVFCNEDDNEKWLLKFLYEINVYGNLRGEKRA